MTRKRSAPRPLLPPLTTGSKSLVQKTPLTRRQFGETILISDIGGRYNYLSRPYMNQILDVDHRKLQIVSARQSGKSTTAKVFILFNATLYNYYPQLYVTAVEDQANFFLNRRLRPNFRPGSKLHAMYVGPHSQNNSKTLSFSNGSSIEIRWIRHDATASRGPSVFNIVVDESQSIPFTNYNVTLEAASNYTDLAHYLDLGTPLTALNPFSRRYDGSLQYEWIIPCQHCGQENPPIDKNFIDEQKDFLFCIHCGKGLQAELGHWESMNPAGKFAAFRIPRLISPKCVWKSAGCDGVLDRLSGPNAYPENQFVNEILGLPEGSGTQPIEVNELKANCGDEAMIDPFNPPRSLVSVNVLATVDWAHNFMEGGRSYTAFALWTNHPGKIKCLYAKRQVGMRYSRRQFALDEMAQIFKNCSVNTIISDHMVGNMENQILRDEFVDQNIKLYTLSYSGKQGHLQKNKLMYYINKTASFDKLFADLIRQRFIFPRWEESATMLKDFLNVVIEYDYTHDQKNYIKGRGSDDFADLCNFARLAYRYQKDFNF